MRLTRDSDHPCGTPLGTRLEWIGYAPDGTGRPWREVPHTCGKPANVKGPDGVMRCVQHDRKARGLSGKWTGPAEKAAKLYEEIG